MTCLRQRWGRRSFLALLGVGLAAAGCSAAPASPPGDPTDGPAPPTRLSPPLNRAHGVVELHSGSAAAAEAGQIALTVDDGFCSDCVAGYVDFAHRTGIRLTFSPNGRYTRAWEPAATLLRPMIDSGQVQLMNHTFTHPDLTRLAPARVREELERNEAWIENVFATSTRPYFRPPFGRRDAMVEETAGEIGYTREIMWNGSYSDSELITPQFLMKEARTYLRRGTIILGHANHPTVLGLFDQILELIRQRQLTPVTLDEMFGTSRPGGPRTPR